jgi:hypothetical protein
MTKTWFDGEQIVTQEIPEEKIYLQGEEHMNAIITPQQMIEYMVEVLDNAVKDYPEEEREVTKSKLLDAFSAAMFKGPVKEKNT